MPTLSKKGLLHFNDRLLRNHRGCNTTPPITIEFKVCTAPVAKTSACESYYQAGCSTSSSAAAEIAVDPCASATPYEVSSELVHVQSLYMDFMLYLAMNLEEQIPLAGGLETIAILLQKKGHVVPDQQVHLKSIRDAFQECNIVTSMTKVRMEE